MAPTGHDALHSPHFVHSESGADSCGWCKSMPSGHTSAQREQDEPEHWRHWSAATWGRNVRFKRETNERRAPKGQNL